MRAEEEKGSTISGEEEFMETDGVGRFWIFEENGWEDRSRIA